MKRTLVALGIVACSVSAQASFYTGNDVLKNCNDTAAVNAGWCLGFMGGVADAAPQTCPASGVTVGQVKDVVIQYLQANPATRHMPGWILAQQAIVSAGWKCQEAAPRPTARPI